MAQYKLIQDIEAEDKILGPLTLRQFIFALVAVFLFYICFVVVVKHVPFLLVLFLPPALFCAFFAVPFGRDQPTEIWALAKLRFWFKPRRRIWNQSGVKELVTITAPKKIERVLTNGLSQLEVKSRLQVLAETLDTRGWAVKHVSDANYAQSAADNDSERLINIDNLPQEVPNNEVTANDDILDETSNPIARQFESMIDESTRSHRQQLMDQLSDIRQGQPVGPAAGGTTNWFMSQRSTPAVAGAVAAKAKPAPEEAALADQLAARHSSRQVSFGNLRTVQPLAPAGSAIPVVTATAVPADDNQAATVTTPSDPAILSLAENDDLNVATLAREASKKRGGGSSSPNEVVIPLH